MGTAHTQLSLGASATWWEVFKPRGEPCKPPSIHPGINCTLSPGQLEMLDSGGFIELCVRVVTLISLFSLRLPVSAVGCSPRGSKGRAVQWHRSASLLQQPPGQFFLLFPVPTAPPRLAAAFPLSRRENAPIQSCWMSLLSSWAWAQSWGCSVPSRFIPHLCLSAPLTTPGFHHLPVRVPSSWTLCSQLLAGQESFITLPCFAFMLWSIPFCSFWIPVAPAGINHWSWVSGALPWSTWFPVKGCC